jgi:hypothetical protein
MASGGITADGAHQCPWRLSVAPRSLFTELPLPYAFPAEMTTLLYILALLAPALGVIVLDAWLRRRS